MLDGGGLVWYLDPHLLPAPDPPTLWDQLPAQIPSFTPAANSPCNQPPHRCQDRVFAAQLALPVLDLKLVGQQFLQPPHHLTLRLVKAHELGQQAMVGFQEELAATDIRTEVGQSCQNHLELLSRHTVVSLRPTETVMEESDGFSPSSHIRERTAPILVLLASVSMM